MRLIEKVWFHQYRAKYWLVPLLFPLTIIFWLLSSVRRLAYKCKLLPSFKINAPVIVVGNIGIGGNGKTPVVLWLIDVCQSQGLTPGVISRGYGGQAPHYPYLLNENSVVTQTGDEPLMIYQRSGVNVCVGPDRVQCANTLVAQGCDIIIADDGLQHYRLQRDIEFIVIDGKRRFGNGLLLPAGPLREGLWRLKTVDYLINNGGKPLLNELPMALLATQVIHCQTGDSVNAHDFVAANPKIDAIAGIGAPERFFTTLRHLGFRLKKTQGFIDHHSYSADDLHKYGQEHPLLMTEKDAIKCKKFASDNCWYLQVAARLPKVEENLLRKKIDTLVAQC
ncbi:MAG: tetraacyldisaccharide 4'-kinase [Thalassotalea sp.]